MRRVGLLAALAAALLAPSRVWACAVCFGAEGDPQTESLNMAILTLLATTYTLFAGMIAAAFLVWRRGKKLAAAEAARGSEAQHG